MSNIFRLINDDHKSVYTFYNSLKNLFVSDRRMARLLSRAVTSLTDIILQKGEIDLFYSSVQSLLSSQLPHFFLPHVDLIRSINWLRGFLELNHPKLTLLRHDFYYYYKHVPFNVIQTNNTLAIILHVPITSVELRTWLDIYELQRLPQLVPNSTTHYTLLNANFYGIAYHPDSQYYLLLPSDQDVSPNNLIDLRHSFLPLQSTDHMSCPLSIMIGTLMDVKTFCGYNIHPTPLPQTVYRIADNRIFVSNISEIFITCTFCVAFACHSHNLSASLTLTKPQSIISLRCGCKFLLKDIVFFDSLNNCNLQNISHIFQPSLMINLPFLTEFFTDSNLHLISSERLFSDEPDVQIPN